MGEVTKIDTFVPPAEAKNDPAPEAVKTMTEQARTGVTRAAAEPEKKADRPTWLPEKFENEEEFAKAYHELEKKQSQGKPADVKPVETKPTEKPADPPKGEQTPEQKTAEAAAQKAGLDVKALEAEYAQNGKLSDDSIKKLADAGFSKDIVDQHIAGLEALATVRMNDLYGIAGGQTEFDQMHAWGAANLSQPEKDALDRTLDSGNHDAIKLAFQGLHTKWAAAGQNEPKRMVHGSNAGAPVGDIYSHRDEVLKDMRNPEYSTNEAFRQKVFEKIKRSNVW